MDFQFDVTTGGRPIKIVSTIDEHTRECFGGVTQTSTGNSPYSNPSCSSRHGTREQLGAVIVMVGTVGRAGFLRTGNGRSFRSVGFPRGREL